MNRTRIANTALTCCAALLLLTACTGGSTEDYRGMYSARLNGFLVQEPPAPAIEAEGEEGAEPPAEEAAAGEGEMAEPMEMVPPANPDIMLDILIQHRAVVLDQDVEHDSPVLLPGVTVDVGDVDADKNEKGSWKVWFDTSTVKKANVTQYTHVLEDVPYEEGDGFYAEIRHPVPAEERPLYSELSGTG